MFAAVSVTVVANDAASADAYATAFMVMGVEKSLQFIDSNSKLELEAYFVVGFDQGVDIRMTKGMSNYLLN